MGGGFSSHPQLHCSSSVPQVSISLKGTNTNPKRIDIYGIDKIYETALKRLKTKTDITEEDKTSINQFVDHLLAKNMTRLRVVKYICHLTVVARIAGKPLGGLDRKGMEKIIGQINTASYADNTKHDYKVVIRKYFQWLRGCDEELGEFPDEVRWIKPAYKKSRLLPEALISGEELSKLAQAAENLRDCELIFLFPTTIDRRQKFLPTVKGQKALESNPANSTEQLGTADDVFRIILYLPTKPTAYQVYDTFNKMLKPHAFESKGLTLPSNPKLPVIRLICEWKILKDKFEPLLKEIETSLGQEWYKFFSRQPI